MHSKYKKLALNTILFAASTFSSKLLVFLMLPLYTRTLSTAEYGIIENLIPTANLLLPLVSLGIMHAVVRFGLDKQYSRRSVFTGAFSVLFAGFCVFAVTLPLFLRIDLFRNYVYLLYGYVLTALLRSLFAQFVRSQKFTRLYALDGLLSTIFTIGFNLLFLVVLKLGVTGYLLAIIAADAVSCLFLFTVAGLHRFIHFKSFKPAVIKSMLVYSLPLIPTQIFWWITNVSDRYLVTYFLGSSHTGIYGISYKIPTIVSLLSIIFIEAWQLSAISEGNSPHRARFFSNIFSALQGVCFISGAGLIYCSRFIMTILVDKSFFEAWRYVPILVIATIFSCFVSFLGSVYMVDKRSMVSLVTMLAGGAINIFLNIRLIPVIGIYGAAIATAVCYCIVFIIRAINSQRYIKISFNPVKLLINILLLSIMSVNMIFEVPYYYLSGAAIFLIIIVLNGAVLLRSAGKLLNRGEIGTHFNG